MAEGKKSFVLYADQSEVFEKLTDEQAGKLIKHILRYVNDENPEAPDQLTEICFIPIKQSLKRDLQKWEKQRNQRIEAGKASAKARQRNSTSVNDRQRNSTVSVNGNVSVSVNDNVINELSNSKELPMSVEDSFDFYVQSWTNATGRTIKTKSSEVAKKAKRSLSARLKEGYTLEEITSAIQKAAKDRHHSESGCKWLTLDFILRPDQLEKWREDPKQKENSRNELEQLIAKAQAERSQRG